jgi:hypothetical protein
MCLCIFVKDFAHAVSTINTLRIKLLLKLGSLIYDVIGFYDSIYGAINCFVIMITAKFQNQQQGSVIWLFRCSPTMEINVPVIYQETLFISRSYSVFFLLLFLLYLYFSFPYGFLNNSVT